MEAPARLWVQYRARSWARVGRVGLGRRRSARRAPEGRLVAGALGALLAGGLGVASALAADDAAAPSRPAGPGLGPGDLVVTLNALVSVDGPVTCRATLLIDNRSPMRVQSFALSVLVHDRDGVLVRQVKVLAMPLRARTTTVATFPVLDDGCARLGSLRILDVPLCADAHGRGLGCRAAMVPGSRVAVPLGF